MNLLKFPYVRSTYSASVPSNASLMISAERAKGLLGMPQITSFHRLSILGITVKTFNKTNCVRGTLPPRSHSLMVLPANCFPQLLPMDRKRSSFCICWPHCSSHALPLNSTFTFLFLFFLNLNALCSKQIALPVLGNFEALCIASFRSLVTPSKNFFVFKQTNKQTLLPDAHPLPLPIISFVRLRHSLEVNT